MRISGSRHRSCCFQDNQTIQIVEGPRIASIVCLPTKSRREISIGCCGTLLDTGQFRKVREKRMVDFDRDLGYTPGDEPYAIQYQIQAMQL